MKLVFLLVEVVLIVEIISNVESQFMAPQMGMGGMQFPPLPPQMSMGAPMPMPPGMPMPMPMPMPGMPMPMSFMGQPKMPMVVMPYHNKKQDKLQSKKTKRGKKDKSKKRKKKKYVPMSSSSGSSSSSESSDVSGAGAEFRSKNKITRRNLRARKHKRRSQVLTPVISYITKDGYVVYQKKIKKEKAKDWLEMGNRSPNRQDANADKRSSSEEMLRTILRRQMDKVRSEAKKN